MINYFWVCVDRNLYNKALMIILKANINIYSIKYYEKDLLLKVSYDDYIKLKRIIPTSYVRKTVGKKRFLSLFFGYKYSVISFILGVLFLIFISNFIFFINIETDNNELKSIVRDGLIKNNLTLFSYSKSFSTLRKTATNIKDSYSSKIEWIEFKKRGVFLDVKVIERVSNKEKEGTDYIDIVASKNGYIRNIKASRGWIVKNNNDYVQKGDVIVSGNILKNNEVVAKTRASASVYAEVWYIVKTSKSLNYFDKVQNSKGSRKLIININRFDIVIMSIPVKVNNSYKRFLFKNNTFSLFLLDQKKYSRINKKYSSTDLENILKLKAKNSITKNYSKDEYIINEKTLKKYIKNGKMYIEIFFRCYEDIAMEKNISESEDERVE